jgi:hypothetical protein
MPKMDPKDRQPGSKPLGHADVVVPVKPLDRGLGK